MTESTHHLHVPNPGDADTLAWALAYAEAGWYVGPLLAGEKSPGSYLGSDWPSKTSRDPEQLVAWWAGTDLGVFLHCGRSGAVALDVDNPDGLPDWLAAEILGSAAPFQSTDAGVAGRGHYVFGTPAGRRFGNGTGSLGVGWGEVRGLNGVIVVAPSVHQRAEQGGRYLWLSTGAVPELPELIAKALPDGNPTGEAALSDAEVLAWLDGLPPGADQVGTEVLDNYLARVGEGGSRHQALVTGLRNLVLRWHEGELVCRGDVDELLSYHRLALAEPPAGQKRSGARRGEAEGILAWALAQPAPDLDFGPAPQQEEKPAEGPSEGAESAQEPRTGAGRGDGTFWQARPELAHVERFARSRLVSPWAVLGCALVQVLLTLPPLVVLPPIIGGPQPAQLFCAVAAHSGGGKSAVLSAARQLLAGADLAEECPVRSGEGISALFRRWNAKAKGFEWVRRSALVTFDEIDTMAGQAGRRGDTSMSTLRSAWSGSVLGGTASDPSKVTVPPMSYRLGLVVGVQYGHAGDLVADLAGTAQRFLWMPGTDDTLERWDGPPVPPLLLGRFELPVPDVLTGDRPVPVCAEARAAIEQGQLDRNRGKGDALDGHALQNRERLALALAVLGGRCEITAADWQLAGVVLARSDATRKAVLAAEPKRATKAEEAVAVDQALAANRAQSAMTQLLRSVARHHADEKHRPRRPAKTWQPGCTGGCLRDELSGGPVREAMGGALARLVADGKLRLEEGRYYPA